MKQIIFYLISVSYSVYAQNHDNIWFVGHEYFSDSSAVMDFSTSTVSVNPFLRNMHMFRTNTSICDSMGNLQFYTNGIWIHNAQHQMMQNGDSLNPGTFANNNRAYGYCVPDGAIAIPHPKQANKYYLFHQSYEQSLASVGFGENLYYTLVDMNANSGLGCVEKKNQFLVSDSICYGQLEVVKHGNGRDWWLIQPMALSNGFYVYLITEDTIRRHSKQYIGNNTRVQGREWLGQAVFAPNGEKYIRYDNANDLDVFDFNRCTGFLSNYLHIPIIDSVDNIQPNTIAAGVAVSASGQYLYISSHIYLYQFDVWATNIAASKDTVAVYDGFVDFMPTSFSFLQLAGDSKIYIYTYANRYFHTIENPNVLGVGCNVQQHSLYLYHYNGLFLPNFPHYRTPALAGSPCDTLTHTTQPTLTEENTIKVYPNPSNQILNIESTKPINKALVYNALGQEVIFFSGQQQRVVEINTRSLENGTYFLSILVEGRIFHKQFQVLR